MRKNTKEDEVSVSFHSVVRKVGPKGQEIISPLNKDDLDRLFIYLESVKFIDQNDEGVLDLIRYRNLAPITQVERVSKRMICGQFQASYWGHSYTNSKKGRIAAESINLRPFFFMVYLSKSGRLYLASQYLGNFGGYTALKNTVIRGMDKKNEIHFSSFNFAVENFKNAVPTEVEVSYHKLGSSPTSKRKFGEKGMLVFKLDKNDDHLRERVKTNLMLKNSPSEVRKRLSKMLKEAELIELSDEEIENCKVRATINGRTKTFFLIEGSNFATRFGIKTRYKNNGHPKYKDVKRETEKVLKDRVLKRVEGE